METAGNGRNVQIYICKKCDYFTSQKSDYNRHCLTVKHKLETAGNGRNVQNYICENCDFSTSQKSDYDRHCSTLKHKAETADQKNGKKTANHYSFQCEQCSKQFSSHSGLWKHDKKCPKKCPKPVDQPRTDLLEILLKRDDEREQRMCELMKRDEEIKKMVTELCKNTQLPAPQTINNTMNNSNNVITDSFNTFNLNVFLNETCKDAVNLTDFIENIKIEMEEMERIGQIGYVNGLSQVINQNLNLLGVEKRPIHCTDAKRQVLYIKNDNEWTKEETNMPRLQRLIDEVQKANLRLLQVWKTKHPGCLTSNSIYTDCYNNLSQELMGGFCNKVSLMKKDEKIKNMIIKDVTIDKQAYLNAYSTKNMNIK